MIPSFFALQRASNPASLWRLSGFFLLVLWHQSLQAEINTSISEANELTSQEAAPLRIAVAANFRPTLKKLLAAYERSTIKPAKSLVSTASTGTLFHQIVHGAPFDLFFAANESHPRELLARGLGDPASLLNYASGQLVLLRKNDSSPANQSATLTSAMAACGPGTDEARNAAALAAILQTTRQLIIANPLTAPYGSVSKQLTEKFRSIDLRGNSKSSMTGAEKNFETDAGKKAPTLLIARNVMHAQQLFYSSAADAAFVSLAQYIASANATDRQQAAAKRSLACHVNPALHKPIRQYALAIDNNAQQHRQNSQGHTQAMTQTRARASALLAFIDSQTGRSIIARDGYSHTANAAYSGASDVE
ncbi:MAG: molybdate ABC transporter substrate-binding protein [Pseudomonadales bacterium]|nr:molybdate ABC transporter substrate-binding protein [Pseudomonadales bacterium]